MQYQTRVRNSTCSFCNILTSVADYSSVKCLRQKCTWLRRSVCGGTIMLVSHREKSRKETSSSKKSANSPDKISVYDYDVKSPSKYFGPNKVLFHIPRHTFTDQRTWWRFGSIRCGFSRDR
ncbi:uncharacterized protein TNCV_760411 [Trichonephila clavipes]|nr:uncharacterized protein TNCV_760411 [Trichonephila clavipes]